MKIEKITKKKLSSFPQLTDFFSHEIITSNANKDGFTHKPESFTFELFNGSKIHTLNSNYDGSRGKRSNCNFYDETGFMVEKAFGATEPFTTQNADFQLAEDLDLSLEPKTFPNQLIYASSASTVDTYFFKKYKEFSKRMMMGDKNYFCADINCDLVLKPMFNGKLFPASLLTQSKIDQAMRENKEVAMREYRNIFQKDGGDKNPFKLGTIIRNSKPRKPWLSNEDNKKHHFAVFYDPSRTHDDSVLLVAEFILDDKVGWRCKIINAVKLVDMATKKKQMMQSQDQISFIREMLSGYNGNGFAEYENIDIVMVDSGSGGGGRDKTDYFMEDWTDKKGRQRRGLIDPIEHEDYIKKYPNAVKKLELVSPKKYRTEMFDAMAEIWEQDLISFPESYDGKGFISVPVEFDNEYEDEKTKQKKKEKAIEYKKVKLTRDEEKALKLIDLLKYQVSHVQRIDNEEGTSHKYVMITDKSDDHDDLA